MALTEVSSRYGAPMGRPQSTAPYSNAYRIWLQVVSLDSGGYDSGGAYWGIRPRGVRLWHAESDCGAVSLYLDAPTIAAAQAQIAEQFESVQFIPCPESINLAQFTAAYFDALEFAECGPDSECNGLSAPDEMTRAAAKKSARDCAGFVTRAAELLREATAGGTYDSAMAGHDFLFSRNGHGVGFWDRGLGALGDKLHRVAAEFGTVDVWKSRGRIQLS